MNIGQKPVVLEFPSTLMEQRTLDARGVLGNSSTTTLELRRLNSRVVVLEFPSTPLASKVRCSISVLGNSSTTGF